MIVIKTNDYVSRKSYNKDIIFKIILIKDEVYYLQGIQTRLIATAYRDDLDEVSIDEVNNLINSSENKYRKLLNSNRKRMIHMTGKILHIDGDKDYLNRCLKLYKDLKIPAYGVHLKEANFSAHILNLINQVDPDIVVLTGHDSYNKHGIKNINNYQTTKYFMDAVKKIRSKYSKDHIFIFAGGCQSNFEALLAAGCNYASSPKRINIDVYDPALVAIKVAITPFNQIINLFDTTKQIKIPKDLLNGVESYGKLRLIQ